MFRNHNRQGAQVLGLGLGLLIACLGSAGAKPGFRLLYDFKAKGDGALPFSSLVADRAGNLYGTSLLGGVGQAGTVFKITPKGMESVLYSFCALKACADGEAPYAALMMDSRGNLYGTTSAGGAANAGTAFRLSRHGTETLLHAFAGAGDGANPVSGLIADSKGNFYGATSQGGGNGCGGAGCGTIFELARNGTEKILDDFSGDDGSAPMAGLISGGQGHFYGTTETGGEYGLGTVFRLAKDGSIRMVHAFGGGNDGTEPVAPLIADSKGNLYGTTSEGGGMGCNPDGCGTVFRIAPDGTETVLYAFAGGSDGLYPRGGLVADPAGNLYGTTQAGGYANAGTVFELSPQGDETVLYAFNGADDGLYPQAGLFRDSAGRLYGTTSEGGNNPDCGDEGCGTVFELTP